MTPNDLAYTEIEKLMMNSRTYTHRSAMRD